jgi:calcineurin-like phosphoesterase family protein
MNEALINNMNEKIREEDTLYHLGDISMAFKAVEVFTPQLICKNKLLIPGNHDSCHTTHRRANGEQKYMYQVNRYEELGWFVLPEYEQILLNNNIRAGLCHLPYKEYDDKHQKAHLARYADSYPIDDGVPLIHGHTHSLEKYRKTKAGTLMIHVGVDAWDLNPVNEDQITEIIKRGRND